MIPVPSPNRVIAVRQKAAEKTASGILLPEETQQESSLAEIVAIGSDITDIQVGDKVVFKDYGSTDITLDGTLYLVIKGEDVLATL